MWAGNAKGSDENIWTIVERAKWFSRLLDARGTRVQLVAPYRLMPSAEL